MVAHADWWTDELQAALDDLRAEGWTDVIDDPDGLPVDISESLDTDEAPVDADD